MLDHRQLVAANHDAVVVLQLVKEVCEGAAGDRRQPGVSISSHLLSNLHKIFVSPRATPIPHLFLQFHIFNIHTKPS